MSLKTTRRGQIDRAWWRPRGQVKRRWYYDHFEEVPVSPSVKTRREHSTWQRHTHRLERQEGRRQCQQGLRELD